MLAWNRALYLWISFIFLLSPSARVAQEFLRSRLGAKGVSEGIFGAFFLLGTVLFLKAVQRLENWKQVVSFFTLSAALSILLYSLRKNPEEAFHMLEYGVLSWLLLRADSWTPFALSSRFVAAANAAAIGVVEELFQWVLPNRIFDIRDIEINLLSAFLVQLALLPFAPARLPWSFSRIDRKRMLDAALVLSLLLFLVGFLGAQHLEQMAREFPQLQSLEAEIRLGGNDLFFAGADAHSLLQSLFFLVSLVLGAFRLFLYGKFQESVQTAGFHVKQLVRSFNH